MKFELGMTAKDKITGFRGIIMGFARYLTGCDQYLIQPTIKSKSEFPENHWFDEGRLILKGDKKIQQESVMGKDPGADTPAPKK